MPVCFIVGLLITVSEPDLHVLAGQLGETVNYWVLLFSVGIGVGVFLVIAFLRIVLKLKLQYVLIFSYVTVFVLAIFTPPAFLPLAFDSGGVTTGPMSVPFIIAIGTGVASMRADGNAESDGFGLTALCSVGPIIAVMILGIIYQPQSINTQVIQDSQILYSTDLIKNFFSVIPSYFKEVGIALLPIVLFFFLFYIFGEKMGKEKLIKIIVGVVYTYFGLVLFLVGVNAGFSTLGTLLGKTLGGLSYNFVVVPIGMLMGFFVVSAEPAVHVLTKQVYEITGGGISKRALSIGLMAGVAVSIGLAMLRILTGINILYVLVPGYVIALVLTFICPDVFTAIAFDSGGVASGAMTASFLLPFALGVCSAVGGNIATDGFGLVAMVAMTPLISIQIIGVIYKFKVRKNKKQSTNVEDEEEIIE